jgi:hypothetical protein
MSYIGNSTIIARSDTTLANGYLLKKGITVFKTGQTLTDLPISGQISLTGFPLRFN